MSIAADEDIVASDFISTSAGAADEGKVPKLNSEGLIDTSFVTQFGDGSDGDVTISSPTTLTRNMYYNNLVVTDVLTTDGYKIYVKGTISGAGTIKWGTPNNGGNGNDGAGGVSGTGGTAAAQSGSGMLKNTAGVAGTNGQAAGGISNPPAGGAGISPTFSVGVVGATGGGGGGGDQVETGSGGAAGTLNSPTIKFGVSRLSVIDLVNISTSGLTVLSSSSGSGSGGGGGSDDDGAGGTGGGGGSGSSGGIIWIAARFWTGTFTISNVGGNGGNGGNAQTAQDQGGGGGGGGGAGGVNIVIYAVKTWTGSHVLTGGTGGTGGAKSGNGVAGSAGSTGTTGVSYEIKAANLL